MNAIFLSYASQDTEAAHRICDALRAAGLEVWFDRSELRGGDAWDASIRKQIKECALFVPIISANTNSREEGYFRLEWKLSVDRSHLMAENKAFFMPVILDDLPEPAALVPDKFRERQWTRVHDDDSAAAFAKRVASILKQEPAPAQELPRATNIPSAAYGGAPAKRAMPVRAIVIAGAIAVAGTIAAVYKPWVSKPAALPTGESAAANSASPEIRSMVKQVEDLIRDPLVATRDNYVLADELVQRVLKTEGNVADYWVLAARVSLTMWEQVYDRSAERKQRATEQVNRALKLSNGALAARALQVKVQSYFGSETEASRLANEVLAEDPANRDALQYLLLSARGKGDDVEADKLRARLQQLPGGSPMSLLFDTLNLARRGKVYEAEKSLATVFALSPTRIVYNLKLELLKDYFLDPQGAAGFVAKVPQQFIAEDAIAGHIAMAYIMIGRGEDALAILKQVPRDYLSEYAISMPKGLLAGLAHEVAGQPAAAALEWRSALALVEKRLAADASNLALLSHKAQLQAMLGQKSAAFETLQLRTELGGKSNPPSVGLPIRIMVRTGKTAEAVDIMRQQWAGLGFPLRSFLVRDLLYLPEYKSLRKDKRVAAMIEEHQAFVQKARLAPGGKS